MTYGRTSSRLAWAPGLSGTTTRNSNLPGGGTEMGGRLGSDEEAMVRRGNGGERAAREGGTSTENEGRGTTTTTGRTRSGARRRREDEIIVKRRGNGISVRVFQYIYISLFRLYRGNQPRRRRWAAEGESAMGCEGGFSWRGYFARHPRLTG